MHAPSGRHWWTRVLLLGSLLLFGACDPLGPADSEPRIDAVVPESAIVAWEPPTLLVRGSDFTAETVLHWNGESRTTRVLSDSMLEADLLETDVAAPDTVALTLGASGEAYPFPVVLPGGAASCDQQGIIHEGAVSGTWSPYDGPHHLVGDVTADSLVIERGTLVCGAPGAALRAQNLTAIGTEEAPIRFTAADSTEPWTGLVVGLEGNEAPPESVMRHVVVEHTAEAGILGASLVLSDVLVRRSCLAGGGSCAGIVNGRYSYSTALERVTVLDSGGDGVNSSYRNAITIAGLRIIGSAGTGLVLTEGLATPGSISGTAEGLRITGSGGYPVVAASLKLLHLPGFVVDSLLGNARDTVVIEGAYAPLSGGIPGGIPVRVVGGTSWISDTLTLDPGASLHLSDGPLYVLEGRELVLQGTPEAPITISGAFGIYFWASPDTAYVSHVHLAGGGIGFDRPAAVEHVTGADSAVISLRGANSRITSAVLQESTLFLSGAGAIATDITVTGAPLFSPSAPYARAVEIGAGGVQLTGCVVTGSVQHGIVVTEAAGAGVRIGGCDIADNAGDGVHNLSAHTVDATGNWWGDPAGPFGPSGDGVSGDVAYEPFSTAPLHPEP